MFEPLTRTISITLILPLLSICFSKSIISSDIESGIIEQFSINGEKFEELKRSYHTFHNKTLEDSEILDAIITGRERERARLIDYNEKEIGPNRNLRVATGSKSTKVDFGHRQIQADINNGGIGAEGTAGLYIIVTPYSYKKKHGEITRLCVWAKRNKAKKDSQQKLSLVDCTQAPLGDILFDSYMVDDDSNDNEFERDTQQIRLQDAGGERGNIFRDGFCIATHKRKKGDSLYIETCDVHRAEQIFDQQVFKGVDDQWKPAFQSNLCVTAKPPKRAWKGGGSLVLKPCGKIQYARGQIWEICQLEQTCVFTQGNGLLDCSVFDLINKCAGTTVF